MRPFRVKRAEKKAALGKPERIKDETIVVCVRVGSW